MTKKEQPIKTFEDQWILHQIVSHNQVDFKNQLVKVAGIYYRFTMVPTEATEFASHYLVTATEGNHLILSPHQEKE